jgi:hypothetical protein
MTLLLVSLSGGQLLGQTAPQYGYIPEYATADLPPCDTEHANRIVWDMTVSRLKHCDGAAWSTPSTVPATRLINTTAPVAGGGDLTEDRTISVSDFVASGPSHARGTVPDPGASAGTTRFLREDATWATPPGGGGGGGNFVSVTIDFGTGNTNASAVITGQSWVTSSSVVVCAPTLLATASREEGAEDAILEGLTAAVHTHVAGTGFTLAVGVAHGRAYGQYQFHCSGG